MEKPMSKIAKMFYDKILVAMQECEEIGGPEREEYFEVMRAVSLEAQQRADTYRQILEAEALKKSR